jgi:hypothetical protein
VRRGSTEFSAACRNSALTVAEHVQRDDERRERHQERPLQLARKPSELAVEWASRSKVGTPTQRERRADRPQDCNRDRLAAAAEVARRCATPA